MAITRRERGGTGSAVPGGCAVPCVPAIPARMAIAAPVVCAAAGVVSPLALHSGARSARSLGRGGPPRAAALLRPWGRARLFAVFVAFALLVPAALWAVEGRALFGDTSSAAPLDCAAIPQAGLRAVMPARKLAGIAHESKRLTRKQSIARNKANFPCAVRLFQRFKRAIIPPDPLKKAYSAAICARHLCRPQQAHPRAHAREGTKKAGIPPAFSRFSAFQSTPPTHEYGLRRQWPSSQ